MFFENLFIALKLKKKPSKPKPRINKPLRRIVESDHGDVVNVMIMNSMDGKICHSNENDSFKGGAGGSFSGAGASGDWGSTIADTSSKCVGDSSNDSHGGYADSSSSSSSSSDGGSCGVD